jgi:hypothetical protein
VGTCHLSVASPQPTVLRKMVGGFVKAESTQPYTSVMVPSVLTAPGLFGAVFVFGMIAAGLGLLFGLLTPIEW